MPPWMRDSDLLSAIEFQCEMRQARAERAPF
jgi:hypothetical protein